MRSSAGCSGPRGARAGSGAGRGAGAAAAGFGAWKVDGIVSKVLLPLVSSPIAGFLVGLGMMVLIFNLFKRVHPKKMNDRFRRLQVVSAGFMAFSHGRNDDQKEVGGMR